MMGAVTTPAASADLGSSSGLADLEERVAELESLAARKGNRKVSLEVYGHVNYSLLHTNLSIDTPWGSDSLSKWNLTNNTNSQTRFGFRGSAKITNATSAGYNIEIGTSNGVGYTGTADQALTIRHSFLWIDNQTLGRFSIGKTSTATDGIVEIDVSNTGTASTLMSFEPLSGSRLGGANGPWDGGRAEVVKYATSSLAGFIASASWATNDEKSWDAALRYAGEFGGFRTAAGIGYRENKVAITSTVTKTTGGSASVMHVATGLFVNGAYGDQRNGTITFLGFPILSFDAMKGWHVQAGIERKWFDLGKTTFYGEILDDKLTQGADSATIKGFGFGAVQGIDAAAMDVYMAYRDSKLTAGDDLTAGAKVFSVGGIIRF